MTNKERIRTEIEKLRKFYGYDDKTNVGLIAKEIIDKITTFIDSLPEESVNTWKKQNESDIYDAVKD